MNKNLSTKTKSNNKRKWSITDLPENVRQLLTKEDIVTWETSGIIIRIESLVPKDASKTSAEPLQDMKNDPVPGHRVVNLIAATLVIVGLAGLFVVMLWGLL